MWGCGFLYSNKMCHFVEEIEKNLVVHPNFYLDPILGSIPLH